MKSERQALWEFYVETVTRITVVNLPDNVGDDGEAMTSIFKVFTKARETLYSLESQNEDCRGIIHLMEDTLRPFLFKWAKTRVEGFDKQPPSVIEEFRKELAEVRVATKRKMVSLCGHHKFVDLIGMSQPLSETKI